MSKKMWALALSLILAVIAYSAWFLSQSEERVLLFGNKLVPLLSGEEDIKELPENLQVYGEAHSEEGGVTFEGNSATLVYPRGKSTEGLKNLAARNGVLIFEARPRCKEINVKIRGTAPFHPLTREDVELRGNWALGEIHDDRELLEREKELKALPMGYLWVPLEEEKPVPTEDVTAALRQGLKTLLPYGGVEKPEIICVSWHQLGIKKEGSEEIHYLFTHHEGYNFVNDNFVPILSREYYVALTLGRTSDGRYFFRKLETPEEGPDFLPSLSALIPEEYREDFEPEDVMKSLKRETKAQAEAYVEEIGRDAEVYSASKAPSPKYILPLLHDGGESLPEGYPPYRGTVEYVEGGIRFIYETFYDRKTDTITLQKRDTEGTVIEERTFQGDLEEEK